MTIPGEEDHGTTIRVEGEVHHGDGWRYRLTECRSADPDDAELYDLVFETWNEDTKKWDEQQRFACIWTASMPSLASMFRAAAAMAAQNDAA